MYFNSFISDSHYITDCYLAAKLLVISLIVFNLSFSFQCFQEFPRGPGWDRFLFSVTDLHGKYNMLAICYFMKTVNCSLLMPDIDSAQKWLWEIVRKLTSLKRIKYNLLITQPQFLLLYYDIIIISTECVKMFMFPR
jgi:hypothetical protein